MGQEYKQSSKELVPFGIKGWRTKPTSQKGAILPDFYARLDKDDI